MAQYYNVVTNPNGSFTIEDIQQICSIDGQSVQLVVEDVNNGDNVISQQLLAYAATPNSTEQTIFSQPTINLGAHVTTAQLVEPRPNVYIIKTNDAPAQQTIFNKTDPGNLRLQGDLKGPKELSICYTPTQSGWLSTHENNETFELVIKKDPSPSRSFATNVVKNQSVSTAEIASPNVVLQAGTDKKSPRFVPVAKRPSAGGSPVGILRTTLQGPSPQLAKVNKMKRNPNLTNNPNASLTARSRASTGSITQLVTSPRVPQARPPIHSDLLQRNLLGSAKNTAAVQFPPEMGQLSERIKQANLKQRQQNEQRQKQPVMAVVAPRTVQQPQGSIQRPRSMGQLMTLNRQQQQLQLLQQQQQQQQQQQELQRRQQLLLQRQQATVTQQSRQTQASTMTDSVEQPMEVDSSETVVHLERLNQLNCTAKPDPEENSSESLAYLQQEINDPHTAIVQQQITGNEAKMLVILENAEQRLITFEVPKEDCTVQDLLDQANIYSSQEPHVSLVSDPALGINYIVDLTPRSLTQEDEQSVDSMPSSEGSTVANTVVEPKTPVKSNNTNPAMTPQPPASPKVSRFIKGMLAVCPYCGMSAQDFNYCMRCKRKLPENVKAVPIATSFPAKRESSVSVKTFYKKGEQNSQKAERETATKRGRGKARGMASRAKQVKEPECLTISSDEEDDSRKQKRLSECKDASNSLNASNTDEYETILEKEPVITNNSVLPATVQHASPNPARESKEGVSADASANSLSTYLTCRTVRIGSYKYVPNDKVLLSSSGLKLEVPLLEDDKSFITVDIKFENLIKVLIHFAKSMPVLFFYTNVDTALKIRDVLGMQDPKGPYFDPASRDHTHKRITLLPEKIPDESKGILKEMYKSIYEELNTKEANDILIKASPKTKNQVQAPAKKQSSTSTNSTNSNGVIQTITVYPPPPAKGGIAINTEDFICLAEDQFLNDVIIDFYLKYLTLEVLSTADHNRTHVFSSYFYKRLTSPHTQAAENTENLSPPAKRHARVQKWTKNVNIFEKDFVVIPINEHAHWFLAIICFPGLVGKVTPKVEAKSENQKLLDKKKKDTKVDSVTIGNTTITPVSTITIDTNDDGSERDEAEGDDEEMESDSDDDDESDTKPNLEEANKTNSQSLENKEVVKVPCILIFDSLAGASRGRVVATLRDYLSCEYQAKMGSENTFTKDTIKGACPRVPQQSNFTDCGLYVLQYVESFFKTPIKDYTLPIKTLKTWFEEIIVTRKREEIANLLTQLVKSTKGNKTINLPNLAFPTQDGKLKQKPEVETRASKLEAENKRKANEAADSKSNTPTSTSDNAESSNDSSSKSGTTQTSTSQTTNQMSCTTDGNLIVQKEAATSTTARSSADTMAFLKNKRIPRLQKSSDNLEDNQAAKKHKGESFDSCK